MIFRPKQSDSLDVMIWKLVLATRNAVPAQVIDSAASSSFPMIGRMVLTLVESTKEMSKAVWSPKMRIKSFARGRDTD